MKILELYSKIMKIIKVLKINIRIMKIMKILEFYARITKIMKIIEFHIRFKKFMNILEFYQRIRIDYEINRITLENYESHEKHIIVLKNHKIMQIIESDMRITKIMKI